MMKTAFKTDVGRIRSVNEDCAAVRSDMNGLTLALLADGMGGHKAGDIASQMTIEVIQRELRTFNMRCRRSNGKQRSSEL